MRAMSDIKDVGHKAERCRRRECGSGKVSKRNIHLNSGLQMSNKFRGRWWEREQVIFMDVNDIYNMNICYTNTSNINIERIDLESIIKNANVRK